MKSRIKALTAHLSPIVVTALFIAFMTTLEFPLEIFWNNYQEFSTSLQTLAPVFSIAFLSVFICFLLPGLIPLSSFRTRYFSFIATLALLIWFNANFMFGNYGAFDDRGLSINITSVRAIAEIVIWVLLLMASVIFSPKIKKIQFQAISILFILSLLLTAFKAFTHYSNHPEPDRTEQQEVFSNNYLTFSNERNVIHIVLDELQSTITEKLIEENPIYRENLDGFIFYPNTVSVYPSTVMTIPVLLSGEIYRNDMDKQQFTTDVFATSPLLKTLDEANFTVNTHTINRFCQFHHLKNCEPIPPKPANNTSLTLLDYSFFKAVPDMLKPKIYREGRWWVSDSYVVQDHSKIEPGIGHLVFTDFNKSIKVADIPPTYKFYHSFIPHFPTLLEADCSIRIKRAKSKSLEERAKQGACAYSHVFDFIEKLKLLGIYDNTMIIISSDHGSVYVNETIEQQVRAKNMDPDEYATALATLMIKPFNARGPLQISLAPASLSDIPNTVISELDLPALENGENILALSEHMDRTREYLYYDWANEYWDTITLPPLKVYSITGDVRNPDSWTHVKTIPEKKSFN